MAWFDGTFTIRESRFKRQFPVEICGSIRCNEDHTQLALLNMFEEGSELYKLADPHRELDPFGKRPFYHAFFADEATKAKEIIAEFINKGLASSPEAIWLFREDGKSHTLYSFGHICLSMVNNQEELIKLLPESVQGWKNAFVLPLKCYIFECPVCHHRTLPFRSCYWICEECGWEDESENLSEEQESGPNCTTIKAYRKKYLRLTEKNPDYTWVGQFNRSAPEKDND